MALKEKKIDVSLGEFNDEKTEGLVANLKEKGMIVGIENLGNYLRQQGIVVKVHVCGMGSEVNVPLSLYGVDMTRNSEEVKDFVHKHLKKQKMSFVPIQDQNQLKAIEASVRKELKVRAIGYEDSFMPIAVYEEFYKYFLTKKEEYLSKVQEIVDKWDFLIDNFKRELALSMDEFESINKDKLYKQIISTLPSVKEYEKSFSMSLSCTAFKVPENLDMFQEHIKKQIEDGLTQDTIHALYDIIGHTLNDAFEYVNKLLLTTQKNESVHPKTLESVEEMAKRIGKNNIFYNDKIEEIKLSIEKMVANRKDKDALIQDAEIIQAKIYCYAKELGIVGAIKMNESVLSAVELVEIYDMIEDTEMSFEQQELSMDSEGEALKKVV